MNRSIFLAGDSTCADKEESVFPEIGWGQVLPRFLDKADIKNYAVNGRSSRSFIEEGRLAEIEKVMKAGDLLLIQFGHNDQKEDVLRRTEPYDSYQDYLMQYIEAARNKSAIPVLLTSVTRRLFDEDGELIYNIHGDYPQAMIELAERENVYLIDIYQQSRHWLNSLGEVKSRECFMFFPPGVYEHYSAGSSDNTHLVFKGACEVASMVAHGLEDLL